MRQFKLAILSALVISLIQPRLTQAQTFNSGSTGADGAFSPAANVVLEMPPDGVFNFTTINVPSGVLVTFNKNAANTPVTFLASGDVTIAGVISVNGTNGQTRVGAISPPGGIGGPGGFNGGEGAITGITAITGSGGRGPGGGSPGISTQQAPTHGTYGASTSFVSLMPLFGGSGGGGGSATSTNGGGGGGGGGAILIASSETITLSGSITANGGTGAIGGGNGTGGSGSGGAIRLAAKTITGTGSLTVGGGTTGRIRLEAYSFSYTGTNSTTASVVNAPGPISAASNPSLLGGLPTLTFSSIGGMSPPSNPTGSTATPDLQLVAGTTNPVSVSLAATNTPVGTAFAVRVIPSSGLPSNIATSPSTGTFSNSTVSGSVTLPQNQTSVLIAFANFTIPLQTAALLPRIDGEEIDRLMLAAQPGEGSALHFVTKSGREVPAREVVGDEMLAMLWREVALSQ